MKRSCKLIVMIPCFNEEKTLPDVLKSIPKKIPGVTKIETLVVDDGSTDKTVRMAKKYHASHIIYHNRNRGLGNAFRSGRDEALSFGADIIVTIDADGQFDASEIPKLIGPILRGEADMVTGSRFLPASKVLHMPRARYFGNKLFTKIINILTGSFYTDTQCGFRAYTGDAALRLVLNESFTYTQEVFLALIDLGMVIREVPIHVQYYKSRKSRISGSLWSYGKICLGIVARASRDIQPLKFFGIPAVFMFLSGIALGGFMFIRYVILQKTSPFRSLLDIAFALIIMGITTMFLALIADMLKVVRHNQEKIIYLLRKQKYHTQL